MLGFIHRHSLWCINFPFSLLTNVMFPSHWVLGWWRFSQNNSQRYCTSFSLRHHGAFKVYVLFSFQDRRGRYTTEIQPLLIDRDQVFPKPARQPASQSLAHAFLRAHAHTVDLKIIRRRRRRRSGRLQQERKRRRPSEREGREQRLYWVHVRVAVKVNQ